MKYAKKGKSKRTDVIEKKLQKDQESHAADLLFPVLPTLNFFKKKSHDKHGQLKILSQIKENIFKISQISNIPPSFLITKQNEPFSKRLKLYVNSKRDIENPNLSIVDSLKELDSEWKSRRFEQKLSQSDSFDLPIKVSENKNKNEKDSINLEHHHKNENYGGHDYGYEVTDSGSNKRQIIPASTSENRLKKGQTSIQNDKTTNSTNTKINFYSDDNTSAILKRANIDAMSLNSSIFFDKDKLNLRTARGFALLIHELTHINQLKSHGSFYPAHSDTDKSHSGSLNNYWEKEALDNENLTLRYIQTSILKRNRSFLPHNSMKENYLMSGNSRYVFTGHSSHNAEIPIGFSNSHFGAHTLGKDEYSGSSSDLSHDYARDKITRLLETASFEPENFGGIDNPFNIHLNDFFKSSNSKIRLGNRVLGLTDYADIGERGYAKNFNLLPLNFPYEINERNKIGSSNILSDVNKSDYLESDNLSMSYNPHSSPVPMFAESNRSIDSLPISTESAQYQISPAMANIGDNSRSQQPNIIDLESLSEKVYQIIQSKIKIQKARMGIR